MILLLDIYIKKLKAGSPRHICTRMFRVALFTIAKKWKQPKYPLMDEWISKMWFMHTEESNLVLRGRKCNMCSTYMNLEDIMQSEISQSQKDKYLSIYLHEVFSQIHRDRK